ncbi:hypothetical protein F5Y11DRAFT_351113 [Daldinia sp. FL1419]|nr:hypothetical protein F5Y11DRAFT_351113 [Daldinia sp. FL1419]
MAGPTAPPDERLEAIHIYMSGIGLQQFFIVLFVVFAVGFHEYLECVLPDIAADEPRKIRIIFRLVEFSSGSTGVSNPLLTNEPYFYVLEATPMMLAILGFNMIHPGKVLVGPDSEMPGFFATCVGLFRRRREKRRFGKLEGSDDEEMVNLQP